MQPFRRILVALAFAESDGPLLDYASMVAGWDTGVTLHLVHSLSTESSATEKRAIEYLHGLRTRVGKYGDALTVECSILRGERLDSLLRFATTERTDLIFLGQKRSRNGRRSLARRLAMTAPCSVWLVPEGSRAKMQQILAPVDLSRRSADALGVATSLAAAAGLDRCLALHVRFDPAIATFEEHAEVELSQEQEALYLFLARIDLHGVDVIPLYEEGVNVAATIERVAEQQGCDLVVMGTRGRSNAASVLLGSETEHMILSSNRPVLAVKHFGARLRFLEALLRERLRRGEGLRFS